jgi:hypothetical protein
MAVLVRGVPTERVGSPASAADLTVVRDDLVGEPREPAEPFRSIGSYERELARFESGGALQLAMLTGGFSSVAEPPPSPPAAEQPARPAIPVAARRSLAQSRRDGLQAMSTPAAAEEPMPVDSTITPADTALEVDGEQWTLPTPNLAPDADDDLQDRVSDLEAVVGELQRKPIDRDTHLEDAGTIRRLADRVYPVVRGRLRGELLIERERRGTLADRG